MVSGFAVVLFQKQTKILPRGVWINELFRGDVAWTSHPTAWCQDT